MARFEYVAIFFGIVVALAIETVLVNLHRLIAAKSRVRWHWMAPATAVNSSLVTLGEFWILWGDRDQWKGRYSFFQFLPFAVALFLMFLAAAATLPDEIPEEGLDLKAFYFDNRRHYWGLVAAYFGMNLVLNLVGQLWTGPGAPWQESLRWLVGDVIGVVVAVLLMIFRTTWVHVAGNVLSLILLLVFLNSIQFG